MEILALTVVLLSTVLVHVTGDDGSVSEELSLYKNILSRDRHAYVRPVARSGDAVQVLISLALTGIESLDERRQVMTSHIWLRQKWEDVSLRWNSSQYDGVSYILMPIEQIWRPDLTPHNSLSAEYTFHHDSQARVDHTGKVLWITQSRLETACYMDLTHFPFDQHLCTIQIGSWAYNGFEVNLSHWGDPEFDLDYGSPDLHQTWEIVNATATIHSKIYGCCEEPYQDITGYVTLKRRASYVTHVFVAPAVAFVLLVPSVFLMPADSASKFVLGSGVLVSQVLMLNMLEQFLPTSYSTTPRLALYYVAIVVLVSLSLAIAALVTHTWDRSRRRGAGVPGFLRVMILKGLGRLVCVHYEDFITNDPYPDPDQDTTSTNLDNISNCSTSPIDGARMIREYNSHVVNKVEWRQLAAIMDRLFCILFLCICVLMAVATIISY